LKKYEKGSSEILFIEEGKETKEFWNLWGFDNKPPSYTTAMNKEWNNWFLELDATNLEVINTKFFFLYYCFIIIIYHLLFFSHILLIFLLK